MTSPSRTPMRTANPQRLTLTIEVHDHNVRRAASLVVRLLGRRSVRVLTIHETGAA